MSLFGAILPLAAQLQAAGGTVVGSYVGDGKIGDINQSATTAFVAAPTGTVKGSYVGSGSIGNINQSATTAFVAYTPGVVVRIAGVDKTSVVMVETLTIEDRLGAPAVLRFVVKDQSAAPTYRPGMLQTVDVEDGGVAVFGGLITGIDEEPLAKPRRGIRSNVVALGYGAYADRVVADRVYTVDRADKSLKYIVSDLRTLYLNQFGVSLSTASTDIGTLDGPTIYGEVRFDLCTVREALDHVCTLAGWVWRITPAKVLRVHAPASIATPVTLTSSNATVRGATWTKGTGQYRNRQHVKYTGGIATVNATTEQSTYGYIEHVVEAPDITDATTAETLGTSLLRKYANLPKVVEVDTFETGFEAGQKGTITITERNVSGAHLVQAVTRSYLPVTKSAYRWRSRIEAVEGDELSGSWVDLWRGMLGNGLTAASGGSVVGGVVVPTGGGAFSAFLGGSRNIDVKHSTWANAPGYVDVYLDSTKFGSTVTARVQVRTTDAATSVQPRILNVTDGTVAGTGSVTTSTSWESQSITVTLASGAKEYRLQLLPGNGTNGVYGIGSIVA